MILRSGSVIIAIAAACAIVAYTFGWIGMPSTTTDNSVELTPARLAALGKPVGRLVVCQEHPISISPTTSARDVVSEDDLLTLLMSAAPLWNPPTVPSLIHELKLWGRGANFTREMLGYSRTSEFIVETLLNDKACRENTTRNGGSFLLDSPYGIRVVL